VVDGPRTKTGAATHWPRTKAGMIVWALIGALIAVLVLRGCVREWTGLPSDVEAQIERQYLHCIGLEETPIWPVSIDNRNAEVLTSSSWVEALSRRSRLDLW
jgi:hypothetical protein